MKNRGTITIPSGKTSGSFQHNYSVQLGSGLTLDSVGDFDIQGNLLDLYGYPPPDDLPGDAKSLSCEARIRQRWIGDQNINDTITLTFKYIDGVNPAVEIKKVVIQAESASESDANENVTMVINIMPEPSFPDFSRLSVTVEQSDVFILDGDIIVSTVGYDT